MNTKPLVVIQIIIYYIVSFYLTNYLTMVSTDLPTLMDESSFHHYYHYSNFDNSKTNISHTLFNLYGYTYENTYVIFIELN